VAVSKAAADGVKRVSLELLSLSSRRRRRAMRRP